jgi:3-dehydroquinate dehydratase type I
MTNNRKQKTENRKPSLNIAAPVTAATSARARNLYLRAARKGLWTEIRLDYIDQPDLSRLFRTLPGPVIATCRHPAEGGKWTGSDAARRQVMEEALSFGVHCLDAELRNDPAWLQNMAARRGDTRIILSWHDFSGTPETAALQEVVERMSQVDAQIFKIVTYAQAAEDNLRVLGLIPQVLAQGREIIAFCMGPLGKWSRIAAPLVGSFMTYAPFSLKGASAPGQLTVNEVKRLWRNLRG